MGIAQTLGQDPCGFCNQLCPPAMGDESTLRKVLSVFCLPKGATHLGISRVFLLLGDAHFALSLKGAFQASNFPARIRAELPMDQCLALLSQSPVG